jgi:hypothetical protein
LILAKDSDYHVESREEWQMREDGHVHDRNEEKEEEHEPQP